MTPSMRRSLTAGVLGCVVAAVIGTWMWPRLLGTSPPPAGLNVAAQRDLSVPRTDAQLWSSVVVARADGAATEELVRALVDSQRAATPLLQLARAWSLPVLDKPARTRVTELVQTPLPDVALHSQPDVKLALALLAPVGERYARVRDAALSAALSLPRAWVLATTAVEHGAFADALAATSMLIDANPHDVRAALLAAVAAHEQTMATGPTEALRHPAVRRLAQASAQDDVDAAALRSTTHAQLLCHHGDKSAAPTAAKDALVRSHQVRWFASRGDVDGARALAGANTAVDELWLAVAPKPSACTPQPVRLDPHAWLPVRPRMDSLALRFLEEPGALQAPVAAVAESARVLRAIEGPSDVAAARDVLLSAPSFPYAQLALAYVAMRDGDAAAATSAVSAAAANAKHPLLVAEVAWLAARAGLLDVASQQLQVLGKLQTPLSMAARGMLDGDENLTRQAVELAPQDARVHSAAFSVAWAKGPPALRALGASPRDPLRDAQWMRWHAIEAVQRGEMGQARAAVPARIETCVDALSVSAVEGARGGARKLAVAAHGQAMKMCKGSWATEAIRIKLAWAK
jgi:hypothetical protein